MAVEGIWQLDRSLFYRMLGVCDEGEGLEERLIGVDRVWVIGTPLFLKLWSIEAWYCVRLIFWVAPGVLKTSSCVLSFYLLGGFFVSEASLLAVLGLFFPKADIEAVDAPVLFLELSLFKKYSSSF